VTAAIATSMVPVIAGTICIGFLMSRGPRGVEAYDRDERSLGTFASVIEAVNSIENAARRAACPTCSDGL
jgi:hypothetical protein